MNEADDALARAVRAEKAGLVASLTRLAGDFSIVEEAVAQAALGPVREAG